MPLSEKTIAKVPVFTGFPDKKTYINKIAYYSMDINTTGTIYQHQSILGIAGGTDRYNNECGAGCWEFEMIPVVGNHMVKLGDGKISNKNFIACLFFINRY